ncbi:MAG: hypothetical protein ACE5WD_12970 [Candidatus Aminicenantia bacterium]
MGVGKIIIGIILFLVGLWLLIPSSWCGVYYCPGLWSYLWYIVLGFVPIFLVFMGIILVWVESEEIKLEKPKRKRKR